MWELNHKEGWAPKNWCFWIVVLEKTWESLGLQGDQTSQSLRKSTLNIHWKEWCWSWSSNTLATWCEEFTHWKRPWCWERLNAGGEGDDRGWDDSIDMNLSKLWKIVKDREAWCAAVHGVAKTWTQFSNWTITTSLKGSQSVHRFRERHCLWRQLMAGPIWHHYYFIWLQVIEIYSNKKEEFPVKVRQYLKADV